MKKTYLKIRKKIAKFSTKVLEITKLNRYIDLEFFDHFVLLGILLHTVLLITFNPAVAVISAFVVGIGKELFDRYVIGSIFSSRAAFLTIIGGVIPTVIYFIIEDLII